MCNMLNQRIIKIGLFSVIISFLTVLRLNAQEVKGTNLFPFFQHPIKYPAITPNGDYMVFLVDNGLKVIAYESFYKNEKWTEPQPFEYINRLMAKTGFEVGGFGFNHDASMMLFHANITGNYDVFYTEKTKGQWGEPVRFSSPVNTDGDEYSPSLSADMNMLFVLRKKPTRKHDQCKELLLFEKDKDDKWIGPVYLPPEFNTGCQETPFIAADNITLYYSSMREDVMPDGKKTDSEIFNIYQAQRINKNAWKFPTMVHALNTKYHNLSPIMNSSGDYFVYNVKAPKLKNQPQNIIKIDLPMSDKPKATMVLSGKIIDRYTKEPIKAEVIVYDAVTSVEKGRYQSTDDGKYSIILTYGTNYKINFTRNGYSHTYYFKDITEFGNSENDMFSTELYSEINLELNIYDNELFYPLTPKVSIYDSISGHPVILDIKPVADGKYNCRLNIGNNYRIQIESDYFDDFNDYFDLRTAVFYSDFEKSIELKSTRKIVVLDVPNVDLKEASVVARNLNRNELITEVIKDREGRYTMALRVGDTYEIDVTKTGYTFFNTTIDIASPEEITTVKVEMEELTAATKLVLNHITFETNSAELNAVSYAELDRVVKLMKDNPEFKMEISAHTDDVGSDVINRVLSDRRAMSVVNYLVTQGIPTSRLQSKGYGKSQPLVPNNSDENRAKNRRVELRIIE